MPYIIRKQACTQSSGKKGSYTVSYTDKDGKKHRACHTSKKKAQGQISAIEMPESNEVDTRDTLDEFVRITIIEDLRELWGQS